MVALCRDKWAAGPWYEWRHGPMGSNQILAPFTSQGFSSGVVANAVATAVAPAVSGQYWYTTRIDVAASGATGNSVVNLSLNGVKNGPLLWPITCQNNANAPAVAGVPVITIQFESPLAPSAVNSAVNASLPSLGTGSTNAAVTIYGYYSTNG